MDCEFDCKYYILISQARPRTIICIQKVRISKFSCTSLQSFAVHVLLWFDSWSRKPFTVTHGPISRTTSHLSRPHTTEPLLMPTVSYPQQPCWMLNTSCVGGRPRPSAEANDDAWGLTWPEGVSRLCQQHKEQEGRVPAAARHPEPGSQTLCHSIICFVCPLAEWWTDRGQHGDTSERRPVCGTDSDVMHGDDKYRWEVM